MPNIGQFIIWRTYPFYLKHPVDISHVTNTSKVIIQLKQQTKYRSNCKPYIINVIKTLCQLFYKVWYISQNKRHKSIDYTHITQGPNTSVSNCRYKSQYQRHKSIHVSQAKNQMILAHKCWHSAAWSHIHLRLMCRENNTSPASQWVAITSYYHEPGWAGVEQEDKCRTQPFIYMYKETLHQSTCNIIVIRLQYHIDCTKNRFSDFQ